MIQTVKYAPHEIAKIFPEMTAEEKRQLARDIKTNGLQEPIILHEGKVLDGRSRQEACVKAGVKPRYKQFAELSSADTNGATPLAWAVSHNLRRRHLTPSQLSMLAAETIPEFEKEAKERQLAALKKGSTRRPSSQTDRNGADGRSAAKAAKAAGVSESNVKKARRLLKADPAKAKAVKEGKMTVHKAVADIPRKPGRPKKPMQLTMSTTLGEITRRVRPDEKSTTVIVGHWQIVFTRHKP